MKKCYLLTGILCLCLLETGMAQHQAIYGSYYFNPEIYNPSFTGTSRTLELALMHRYQWLGIEEAPVTSSFNIQIPTRTRMSVGFTALSDQSVFLRKNFFYSTFAYMVALGKNHYFQFGLSGGMATQSIDLSKANMVDPAILQAAQSQVQWLGQFGVHYRKKHLILGFSIPKYQFTAPVNSQFMENEQYFNWTHRMDMLMLTADYRLPLVANKVALEPGVLYRIINQSANQLELSGIIHLQNLAWVGSAYRQQQGFSAMAGIHIKKKLKIGYVYEMGAYPENDYTVGSHEFQIGLTTGKIKNIRY